jgi:multimeric flavodoxin WrbA
VKIIAINGSPREDGNTFQYLNMVLEEAKKLGAETELVQLAGKEIKGCRGCYQCVQAKKCTQVDDFQSIFPKIVEADAILLGSPVYHSSITAELKAVLDRAGFSGRWAKNEMKQKGESYQWGTTALSGKVVVPVTAARRAGHNFAFAQILLWAAANDCIIVGNTYWNVGVAGKGGAKDASDDAEGVGIMENLARRVVALLERL